MPKLSAFQTVETRITQMIVDDMAALGYELVRLQVLAGGSFETLQIMADRIDGQPVMVEDCGKISRMVADKIEADVALKDRFTLEVSSPGIDRPLIRLKDYERFKGHLAKVELAAPVDGRRRFQGSIKRISNTAQDDSEIAFETDNGEVCVPLSAIARAKLIMTDALLKVGQDGR